jgi:hypothetical protein
MNKYMQVLMIIAVICFTGSAAGIDCSEGTCEYNVITQINTAATESGKAQIYESGSLDGVQSEALKVEQIQVNCAAVIGESNTILQSNTAEAYGVAQDQMQDNIALVVGSSNAISQENNALAAGIAEIADEAAYGSYETQSQENLLLIIGCENTAIQSNTANAYSEALIFQPYPVEQIQSNVGLLLGTKDWLVQNNNAIATMFKHIKVDPAIRQMQRNVALAANNCEECEIDTIDPIEYCWKTTTNPEASANEISCAEGEC